MQRWPVGKVEIVRIVDEELALPPAALADGWEGPVPPWCMARFADDSGDPLLAFSALAIRAADGTTMVVDPWLANDAARTRDDAEVHVQRLLDQLAAAGFPPDAVDAVVLSHLDGIGWTSRPDGAGGWIPTFPTARYLLAHEALDAWRTTDLGTQFPGLADLVDAGVLDAIDPPVALAPGVSLEPAPGHGPGHSAVRIESGGRLAIYAGHLFLTPLQVADPSIPNDDDPQIASGVRHAILDELAERDGLLLTTLIGGPGGGLVRRSWDGPGFRLEPL